jgi:nucleoside-diphosphate-sugar epimerase
LGARSERVLITGGAGFTGRPLAARLREDGRDVIAASHGPSDHGVLSLDLRNFDHLTGVLSETRPSAVVHLAGIAAPSHSDIGDIYSANVVGTANLFAALSAVRHEPEVVIVASSGHAYAPPSMNAVLTEECPLAPKSHYAVSKRAAEDIARIYSKRFPVIITRPFNYTGPRQSLAFLVPKLVWHYAEGAKKVRLGNLDLWRDFSDIQRVVEAYFRLVSNLRTSTTVNICSGRVVHLTDILTILEEISGRNVEIVTDPALVREDEPHVVAGCPAHLESLVGPLPNPEFRDTLLRMYKCQTDRFYPTVPPG